MVASGVQAIVLDIEGTTTSVAFVYEVLFPYARSHLLSYLRESANRTALTEVFRLLRHEWSLDVARGACPPEWSVDAGMLDANIAPGIAAYVQWLMDRDRKSPGLKLLQGQIWEEGYRRGGLKGEVFEEVAPALKRWRDAGIDVAIYSSGSEQAQRLLFGSTAQGDLTPFIVRFFDTAVGPKQDPESYRRIAHELECPTERMLFISDVTTELDAARTAGCQTRLCVRPGNRPQPEHSHAVIRDLSEVTLTNLPPRRRQARGHR